MKRYLQHGEDKLVLMKQELTTGYYAPRLYHGTPTFLDENRARVFAAMDEDCRLFDSEYDEVHFTTEEKEELFQYVLAHHDNKWALLPPASSLRMVPHVTDRHAQYTMYNVMEVASLIHDARSCIQSFYLPSEQVLYAPTDELRFDIGRAYGTYKLDIYKGVLRERDNGHYDYHAFAMWHGIPWDNIKDACGSVYVVEIWTDYGDDGHTSYGLRGYALMTDQTLQLYLNGFKRGSKEWLSVEFVNNGEST